MYKHHEVYMNWTEGTQAFGERSDGDKNLS